VEGDVEPGSASHFHFEVVRKDAFGADELVEKRSSFTVGGGRPGALPIQFLEDGENRLGVREPGRLGGRFGWGTERGDLLGDLGFLAVEPVRGDLVGVVEREELGSLSFERVQRARAGDLSAVAARPGVRPPMQDYLRAPEPSRDQGLELDLF
jgi:hypothetical protein